VEDDLVWSWELGKGWWWKILEEKERKERERDLI
jgi:hypothetical protein